MQLTPNFVRIVLGNLISGCGHGNNMHRAYGLRNRFSQIGIEGYNRRQDGDISVTSISQTLVELDISSNGG
jgi:hypothetical protein